MMQPIFYSSNCKRWYRALFIGAFCVSVMLDGIAFAVEEGAGSGSLSVEGLVRHLDTVTAANDATNKRLLQLTQELENLKFTTMGAIDQLHKSRLALALLQLRIASQTHFPFDAELTLVRQLGGASATELLDTVAVLAPHAATGVAMVSELRDSFGLILLPKLEPLLAENNVQGWVDWALSWVNLVLVPFSSSTMQPTSRQQMVISANDRLTEDDLHGAVQQLEQLDGPAAALVVRWLKEANARLAVDAAYNSLSGIAVALFGHTPSTTPP